MTKWKIKRVKMWGNAIPLWCATKVTENKGKLTQEQHWNSDKSELKKKLEEL
jgi:valyl-tRNA synthetase